MEMLLHNLIMEFTSACLFVWIPLSGDQSCHFAAAAREPLPLETPPRAQPHHWGQAGGLQARQQVVLLYLVRWLSSPSPHPKPPHQDLVLCPTAAGLSGSCTEKLFRFISSVVMFKCPCAAFGQSWALRKSKEGLTTQHPSVWPPFATSVNVMSRQTPQCCYYGCHKIMMVIIKG